MKAGEARVEGFWGFEEHGVCPDIVTMAKAAGNGHPLGFVLVQSDIAEDFKTCEVSMYGQWKENIDFRAIKIIMGRFSFIPISIMDSYNYP